MNMTLAVLGSKNFLVASLLSGPEIMVVCIVILVLFGAKKIPEFAKGLGKGISEFKKASSEVTNEIQQAIDQPAPTQKTNTPATPASQDVNQPPTVTKI